MERRLVEKDQLNRSLNEELKTVKSTLHSKEGNVCVHCLCVVDHCADLPTSDFVIHGTVEVRHLKDELQASANVLSVVYDVCE